MNWIQQRTSQIIVLFLILTIGVMLGSTGRALHPDWSIWENLTFQQGMGIIPDTFMNCIFTPVFWLALMAALGLSAAGAAGTPLILIMRGAALGAILEQLYANESFIGFLKIILFVMPYAFSTSVVMLFGAREAFRFSIQIIGLLCDKTQDDGVSVRLYMLRFFILFIFMIILSFVRMLILRYGYSAFISIFLKG